MEELTGFSSDEVLGKHLGVLPFLKDWEIETLIKRALSGEAFTALDLCYSFPKTGRKGWNSVRFAPVRNARGEIIGAIATTRDTTERKQMEISQT
jgi:PAS domain S-box-containing protein